MHSYKFTGRFYVFVFCGLTWLGANAPELPFLVLSQCFTLMYFGVVILMFFIMFFRVVIYSCRYNL